VDGTLTVYSAQYSHIINIVFTTLHTIYYLRAQAKLDALTEGEWQWEHISREHISREHISREHISMCILYITD